MEKSAEIFAQQVKDSKVRGDIIYADDPDGQITQILVDNGLNPETLVVCTLDRTLQEKYPQIICVPQPVTKCLARYQNSVAAVWLSYDITIKGDNEVDPRKDIKSVLGNPHFQTNGIIGLTVSLEGIKFWHTSQSYNSVMYKFAQKNKISNRPNTLRIHQYDEMVFVAIQWGLTTAPKVAPNRRAAVPVRAKRPLASIQEPSSSRVDSSRQDSSRMDSSSDIDEEPPTKRPRLADARLTDARLEPVQEITMPSQTFEQKNELMRKQILALCDIIQTAYRK